MREIGEMLAVVYLKLSMNDNKIKMFPDMNTVIKVRK